MKLTSRLRFQEILSYCESKGYLKSSQNGLSLGYLGAELQCNSIYEWRRSIKQSEGLHILPAPTPGINQDIFDFHSVAAKLILPQEPFGYFHSIKAGHLLKQNICENVFLKQWNPNDLFGLQMVFFSQHKKSTRWFDYWTRERLSWWRKFSGKPFLFKFSDVLSNADNQEIQITFSLNGEEIPVESICNLNRSSVEKYERLKLDNINTSVIICETVAENVAISLLVDSYHRSEENIVMRLHHQIAPFKVAMAIEAKNSDSPDIRSQLHSLASFISNELQKADIFPFPNKDINCLATPLKKQFQGFDEIGLPYVIVISADVLKSGIVGLRNRDTMLEEKIHVSELKFSLFRYLQHKFWDN